MNKKTHSSDTVILKFSTPEGLVKTTQNSLNRALLFGDGVFETMVYVRGKIRFAEAHEKRLNLGLSILKINPPDLSIQELESHLQRNFNESEKFRIRWNVYRGGLGKYTPLGHFSENLILVQKMIDPIKIKTNAY